MRAWRWKSILNQEQVGGIEQTQKTHPSEQIPKNFEKKLKWSQHGMGPHWRIEKS